jgi:hypothetical protein
MDDGYTDASYGDRIADIYDESYLATFADDTVGAVSFLSQLAAGGPALELGIGTGRVTHHQLDLVPADVDPAAGRELGMHTDAAVGLARGEVDLGDEVGEPGVADRPLRRRRLRQA